MSYPPTRPVAVLGATGRMGRLVVAEVLAHPDTTLAAAVTRPGHPLLGTDAGEVAGAGRSGVALAEVGPDCFGTATVVIDFSLPEGLAAALPHVGRRALVSGTTGLPARTVDSVQAQAGKAPVLVAANFSTGVNVLLDLVARAAQALPDYDIEIVEAHHHHKVDAPSGTALALGHAAAEARGITLEEAQVNGRSGDTGPRRAHEIGLHALRAGDVVLSVDGQRVSAVDQVAEAIRRARAQHRPKVLFYVARGRNTGHMAVEI